MVNLLKSKVKTNVGNGQLIPVNNYLLDKHRAKCRKYSKVTIKYLALYLKNQYYDVYEVNDSNILVYDVISNQFMIFKINAVMQDRKHAIRKAMRLTNTKPTMKTYLRKELLCYMRDEVRIKKMEAKLLNDMYSGQSENKKDKACG